MKKLIVMVCLSIMMINVYASTNKLYFDEQDGQLYYDTDALDKNVFMNHIDMVPGKVYKDELLIENGSQKSYSLYFQISDENGSVDLLENIKMTITLDGKTIYDGNAKGMNYEVGSLNIVDAAFIGKYAKNTTGNLVVTTTLDKNYSDPMAKEAKINWNFYGISEDEIIPIIPNTHDDILKYVYLFLGSIILLILIITFKRLQRERLV